MKIPAVRCGDCGFLALRAILDGRMRAHAGYHEVEQFQRDTPAATFNFAPGETNALHTGELVCFRHAADLPRERDESAAARKISTDHAISAVIWNPRPCDKWHRYQPGIDPPRQLDKLEARRLAKIATLWTVGIGVATIIVASLAITSDSIALRWLKAGIAWLTGS